MKEIQQRVQSLSGLLASPVDEDDYAEKGRRVELLRFASSYTNTDQLTYLLSGSLKGSLQNLNHLPNKIWSLGSFAMPLMPRS